MILLLSLFAMSPGWELSFEDMDLFVPYEILMAFPIVSASPDGRVAVTHPMEKTVKLIGPDGRIFKSIGGKGQGPGEFSGLALSWNVDGQWWIIDSGNKRLSKWSADGALLNETHLTERLIGGFVRNRKEAWYLRDSRGQLGTQPTIVCLNLNDKTTKEVWKMAPLKEQSGYHESGMSINLEWDPFLKIAAGSNFLAAIYSSEKSLTIIHPETGKVLAKRELSLPAVPLSDSFYNLIMDSLPPDIRGEIKSKVKRPEFFPYLHKLYVDGQDRIWMFGFQDSPTASAPYHVFDRNGKLLSNGNVPGLVMAMSGRKVYVAAGEDDALTLSAYEPDLFNSP